jgi:hypothetical protein
MVTTTVVLPGVLEYFVTITATEKLSVIQFPVLLDGIPLIPYIIIYNVQQLDPGITSQPTQVNGAYIETHISS